MYIGSSSLAIDLRAIAFVVENSDRIKIVLRLRDAKRAPDLDDPALARDRILSRGCCSRSYTAHARTAAREESPQAGPTPVRSLAGETKLKASRADDSPPSPADRSRCPSRR
jgi:hypothetical protein